MKIILQLIEKLIALLFSKKEIKVIEESTTVVQAIEGLAPKVEEPKEEPKPEPPAKQGLFSSFQEAEDRYGKIVDYKWDNETSFMVLHQIPNFVTDWINTASGSKVKRIYINKDCVEVLNKALYNLKERGLLNELKTFDGCFNIRDVRGIPGKVSTHAYGLAIDLNAQENPLKQTPVLSAEFVKCWTDAGWVWGGNFTRKDGMHFEYAWNKTN